MHGAPTTKDANATQRGKVEFERGLQNVSGNNTTSTNHGYSTQTTEPGAPTTQGGHFPKHHREDAVLGTGQYVWFPHFSSRSGINITLQGAYKLSPRAEPGYLLEAATIIAQ